MIEPQEQTQPCCSAEDSPLYQQLDDFIEALPQKKGHLVTVLHKAQSLFGYLPREIQQHVASRMNESLANVYGVVSFYTFFTMVPRGKYPVSVCMGTACFVKNAEEVLEAFKHELGIEVGEVTADGLFSIDTVRCVGACGLAPIVLVGERVFGHVSTAQVKEIIAEFRSAGSNVA